MGIFDYLKRNAELYPDKIGLIIDGKHITYRELFKFVLSTISNLKKNNFSSKSVVLIIQDNTLAHILSLFALAYLNSTIVPVGEYYLKKHISKMILTAKVNSIIGNKLNCFYFVDKFKIKNVLCTEISKKFNYFFKESKTKISLNKKINIKKNFIITMSSGSTAEPKPIVFSQKTKIVRYKLFENLYNLNKKDCIIVTSPIDHSLGMRTLYVPLLCGATCVVMKKFSVPEYCELIKKHNVSFSVLVASQIYQLLENKEYFNDFWLKKGLVSASTKLFSDAKNKIIKKKINLYEMYGAAEIGTVTSINISKDKNNYKSVGKIYNKNIKIKILSNNNFLKKNKIGEIICKTPGKFKCYFNSKTLNKNSFYKGFFKTGDVGYLDKNNYLYFLSRKKNIIRRSGITIYPEDIENIFLKDKKINQIAVVGKEEKLETKLYFFFKKNKFFNEHYIKNICLKKLATFQMPNKIIFLEEMPKTNLGKINKLKLFEYIT